MVVYQSEPHKKRGDDQNDDDNNDDKINIIRGICGSLSILT